MQNRLFTLLAMLVASTVILNGCMKDELLEKYSFYRPIYKSKADVRAEIRSGAAKPIQNPGKLFVRGNYIFLNDVNRGIHVIDYSNAAAPSNIAFIAIPGNVDLAVNGNYLYADHFTDLVTLDISNPLNVVAVNFDEKVFPIQYFVPDTNLVVYDWVKVDTIIKHAGELPTSPGILFNSPFSLATGTGSAAPQGVGGSMARFALMNERLYTVSTSELNVFSLLNAADPSYTKKLYIGAGDIETIYPFKERLFVGSRSGMHIFSVANPDNPTKTGTFTHASACDPVIADDNYAYVTLRSGNACENLNNQMDIVNITNVNNPVLVKTYLFSNPHGLAKDGDHVFLCDGKAGLKILNVQNVNNVTTVKTIPGIDTYDVIALNNVAITVAKTGLYFIDYSNLSNAKIISKISIQ